MINAFLRNLYQTITNVDQLTRQMEMNAIAHLNQIKWNANLAEEEKLYRKLNYLNKEDSETVIENLTLYKYILLILFF